MKRKIIKQGKQAYTITLPVSWIRKYNLDKQAEIDLEMKGNNLIIKTQNSVLGNTITINVNGLNSRNIYLHIAGAYAKGVDEIILISNEDITSIINGCLHYLIGFGLIAESGNRYIIKDITKGDHAHVDEIFKRVFQMIQLFFEAAIKDIYGDQKETLEHLKSRDREVNKFCLYLQRSINKQSYDDINGRIIFTYSYCLEKISDEIDRLWRTNIKYNVKKSGEIKKILNFVNEGLGKSFDLYYQFNKKHIEDIYDLREKVRDRSLKIKGLDANTIRFVRHSVKIIEEAADLNHLAIMKQV